MSFRWWRRCRPLFVDVRMKLSGRSSDYKVEASAISTSQDYIEGDASDNSLSDVSSGVCQAAWT